MTGSPYRSSRSGSALHDAASQIEEISTLPHVALRVMQIAGDPTSSAADLQQALEGDAALSARVLRYVNSSAYALRSRINNLQQAVAYLGTKPIRNLAMTANVSDLFQAGDTFACYSRCDLWRHLVAVALCSRLIASRLRIANPDDLFLAGLLHDIGIILEDQHFHEAFVRVIHSLRQQKPLAAVEREHLGFSHIDLGLRVADRWGFPEPVQAVIRFHHTSMNCTGEHLEIVRCVELANVICTQKGIPSVGFNLVRPASGTLPGLGLDDGDVRVISGQLDDELEANRHLLSLSHRATARHV